MTVGTAHYLTLALDRPHPERVEATNHAGTVTATRVVRSTRSRSTARKVSALMAAALRLDSPGTGVCTDKTVGIAHR